MTRDNKAKSKKKYRVRYDRIVVLMLIIAVIAVLISSCVNGIKGKDNKANAPELPVTTTTTAKQTTTATAPPDEASTPTEAVTETTVNPQLSNVSIASENAAKGNLVLVNHDYEYTFPENDIEAIPIVGNRNDCYQAGDYVTKLDKEVIVQLNALMEAYAASKNASTTDVFVQDGFRTYDEQEKRHSSGKSKTFSAGHTDYHTGRTFDMFLMNSDSSTGYSYFEADDWFNQNCGNYGFILRYPEGKQEKTGENPRTYTYRYVGAPHSVYINQHKICLEEYIEKVKGHTNEAPLEISAGNHTYNVYYVPTAENGETEIPVPADKEYTVSGCNAGGFIVTVTIS